MPIVFSDDFPSRLLAARGKRSLSQQELADAIGVSRKSMSRYESGLTLPRAGVLLRIASTLDVDPGWLTGAEKEVDRAEIEREAEIHESYPSTTTGTPVHLSISLRRKILSASRDNQRSLHDEIVSRLESSFERTSRFYAEVLREAATMFDYNDDDESIAHHRNSNKGRDD